MIPQGDLRDQPVVTDEREVRWMGQYPSWPLVPIHIRDRISYRWIYGFSRFSGTHPDQKIGTGGNFFPWGQGDSSYKGSKTVCDDPGPGGSL